MNKKVLIISSLAFLFAVAIVVLILFLMRDGGGSNILPTNETQNYSSSVTNAINNPIEEQGGWKTLVSSESDEYQLSYNDAGQNSYFAISINANPVLEVLKKAESEFLQKLSITEQEACNLPISIMVPYAVEPNLAGIDFGFSFCNNKLKISDVYSGAPETEINEPEGFNIR